jgi:hypothetical protein
MTKSQTDLNNIEVLEFDRLGFVFLGFGIYLFGN